MPGKAGNVGGGLTPGDVRVMATIDYAFKPNLLIGARVGYALNTYPGQSASTDGRASSFTVPSPRGALYCRSMSIHLDHVVLWVEDAPRALDFYTNVVGLTGLRAEEFLAGTAPFPSVRVSEGTILDLVPAIGAPLTRGFTGETKPTAAGLPINHLCLAMDQAEFEALSARLAIAAVPIHRVGDRSYGARGSSQHWFYFQDPDGNMLEARYYDGSATT